MSKQDTAAFKTRVVQEMLKEEKALAQIAANWPLGFFFPFWTGTLAT